MQRLSRLIMCLLFAVLPALAMAADSVKISLNNGWKMVSIPFTPSEGANKTGDAKIAAILGTAAPNVLSVWSWNPTTNSWSIYPESLRNDYNNAVSGTAASALTELTPGNGYWFRTNSDGASFTITTPDARPSTTQTLATGNNVFNLIGFSFEGNVDISALDQGDSPLLSLDSGDTFRLWHWEGADWCIYTNEEGGVAKLNQTYGLTLGTCDRLKEGSAYWVQVSSGGKSLGLALPPSPSGAKSSVYGNVSVTIDSSTKVLTFYENDYVTPINEVEVIHDSDKSIITFQKEGYVTRRLGGVSSVNHLKSSYSLIKEDPSSNDMPEDSNHGVLQAPADKVMQDGRRSARVVISGTVGDVGALVTVTPMQTIAGTEAAQELAALGKVIGGFSVSLRSRTNRQELQGGYRAFTNWAAVVTPVLGSGAFLNSSGSENPVITPLNLYKTVLDPDRDVDPSSGQVNSNGQLQSVGKLKLYYYDSDPDNDLTTSDGKWVAATKSGNVCAVEIAAMTTNAVSELNEIQTDLKTQNGVQVDVPFASRKTEFNFRRMRGEVVLSPEDGCVTDQLYSAYAYVLESSVAPSRALRIQVVDNSTKVGIANASVLIDGMLEYTTDENGYLKPLDGTTLDPAGMFEYSPTLGTKKLVIVARGEEHYANAADIAAGALKQCTGTDFATGGACVGEANDVILELQKRALTGTIVGLVQLRNPYFGLEAFPEVTVSARYPTSVNAEQVSTDLDENSEFTSFTVGADATAKFRWSFYPIEGTAKIEAGTTNTARIVTFREGGAELARISTVKDASGNDVMVPLPNGGTATLSPIFVGACINAGESGGHHTTCTEDERVLSGSYGQILGSDGGHNVTKKQILNAIVRENYLAGDFGVYLDIEHCIPLILTEAQIAEKIPAEEQCTRTEAEAGFAYTGKVFVETLQGGTVRVEVKEDAASASGTISQRSEGDATVLGGVELPYFYSYAAITGIESLKWYATVVFQDSEEGDLIPGTQTPRTADQAYDTINPPTNCENGPVQYYLNFAADEAESNVATVWTQTQYRDDLPGGNESYCTAFNNDTTNGLSDSEYVDLQTAKKQLAVDYGVLLQEWKPGDSTDGFVLNSEVINQKLLERFAQLNLPIDTRFTNGSTKLKEDDPNGSLSFLQDYVTVVVTVVIENPDDLIEVNKIQTALAFFDLHLSSDKVYEGIEISAGDFKPTSEVPVEVTTITDPDISTLDGEALSLNYQFNGIPFSLSDLLRLGLRVGPEFRPVLFDENNQPLLDIRFDQARYGGNGNGVIDGDEIRQYVSEFMPVGHFEPDNTGTGIREDVAQVNLTYEATPTGHIRGTVFSSSNSGTSLNNARVYLGNDLGETQTLTSNDGKFVFTDILVGTYQMTVVAGDQNGDGTVSESEKHLAVTFSVVVEADSVTEQNVTLVNNSDGATTLPYLVIESVSIDQSQLGLADGLIRGYALQSASLPVPNKPPSSGSGAYEVSCTLPTTPGGSSDCYDPDTGSGGTAYTNDTALTLVVNGVSVIKTLPAGETDFEFRFPLEPGENKVTMSAYNSIGANFPATPEFVLDFTPPVGSIYGQVKDRDTDAPLANALVVISTEGFRSVTTTDSNGNFLLEGAPALRTVAVEVGKYGYGSYAQELFLERGGRATLNISLDPTPAERNIDETIPPRILMQIARDVFDPSLWIISGSVENTDAESIVFFLENYETGDVESKAALLQYGGELNSTHSLFSVRHTLRPGYNLIQTKVVNSNGKQAYSRVMDITVPFSSRKPMEFTLESQDPSRDAATRSALVKGSIKGYYPGSVIQVLVNGSLDTDRTRDANTKVDTNNDGSGDTALADFTPADSNTPVNIYYEWDGVTLENDIMNTLEVKLIIANDVDGDGNLDVSEDLDGDGRLDPHNGSFYVGPGSNNPLTSNCDTGLVYLGGEDTNCNGTMDAGEDRDGDGNFDIYPEDADGDLALDQNESSEEFAGTAYSNQLLVQGFPTPIIPQSNPFPGSIPTVGDDYITVGLAESITNGYSTVELWVKPYDETCTQARSGWFRTYAYRGTMSGWYGQTVDKDGIMTAAGTSLYSINTSNDQLTQTIPAVKAGCYQILGAISQRKSDDTYPTENAITFDKSGTPITVLSANGENSVTAFPWVKWYWGPWYVYQGWLKVPATGTAVTFHECTGDYTKYFQCEKP